MAGVCLMITSHKDQRLLARSETDSAVAAELTRLGFDVDYVITRNGRRFGAATLGQGAHEVRLIDNLQLEPALAEAC